MNLLTDPFFPIQRADGQRDLLTFTQLITETVNPPTAFAAPRPDFDGALLQLGIGLLQTLMAPKDHQTWARWMQQPPDVPTVEAAIAPHIPHFQCTHDGPSFMQDLNLHREESKKKPIEVLLINSPGKSTKDKNTDFLTKRNSADYLCERCTFLALFCLQVNGPQGGTGHRVGLRGGGPVTTLFAAKTLWETLWLGVMDGVNEPKLYDTDFKPDNVFPWLAPCRESSRNQTVSPTMKDVHPLMVYWPMPRRIRLNKPQATGNCRLCGDLSSELFTTLQMKKHGNKYSGWHHPLTPHYMSKKKAEKLPLHGQPGFYGYQHWLGLIVNRDDKNQLRSRARVIDLGIVRRSNYLPNNTETFHVFGYDMDKWTARSWIDRKMPILGNIANLETLEAIIEGAILCAEVIATNTHQACLEVLCPGKTSGKKSKAYTFIKEQFWQQSEPAFFKMLQHHGADESAARAFWLKELPEISLNIFDRTTAIEEIPRRRYFEERHRLNRFNRAPKSFQKHWPSST